MNIIYQDEDVVVVDKPLGMAVHPTTGWTGQTVTSEIAKRGIQLATVGVSEREGVVHRLDANTTGVMVLTTSFRAYHDLKEQFHDREVTKVYHALVQGHPDPTSGTVDAPIDRHPKHRERFAVVSSGRDSKTHYETLEAFRGASLLELELETGRTHQIRVHMSAIGHPCVGDTLYGADPTFGRSLGVGRQWLHAKRLGFKHPGTGEPVSYESEYAPDLVASLAQLNSQS